MDRRKARRKGGSRRKRPTAHALEYVAFRAIAGVLGILPLESASTAMGWLWRRIGPRTSRNERIGRNLSLALPHLDATEHARIADAQWDNLGRTYAETLLLERLHADPDRIRFSPPAELDARIRQAKFGTIFVSMHSANWELAGFSLRRYGTLVGLYRRFSNPLTNEYVRRLRALTFLGGLLPKGPDTAQVVMRAVRSGTSVGILADLREGRGIAVRFFGQETTANPFPAMVARRFGAMLVAIRVKRREGVRFDVEAVEIPVQVTGSYSADVRATTQAIMDLFEDWIRDRPEEWMWVQDRWRPMRASQSGSAADAPQALSDPKGVT